MIFMEVERTQSEVYMVGVILQIHYTVFYPDNYGFIRLLISIIGSLSNFHTTERLDIDRQQTSTFYMGCGA